MKEFFKAESIGRDKFKSLAKQNPRIEDLEFTEDAYNNVDAYFTFNGKKYAVEIKNRNSYYNIWNIEELKYIKMKELIENNTISGGYFVVFFENTAWIYDFNTIEYCYNKYGISSMMARRTTVVNSNYVEKKVISLPTEIAKIKMI